jgi:transcriptional antiterminator RfaH
MRSGLLHCVILSVPPMLPSPVPAFQPPAPAGAGSSECGPDLAAAAQPWYLAYTKPRQEHIAELNLRQQGFLTYLPLFKVLKRGAEAPVNEPMFPRYLLLRPAHPGQSLSTVRSTRGVAGLVRFGVEPGTLSDSAVQGIRSAEQARAQLDLAALAVLRPGQGVVFVDGAFQGLAGLVTDVSASRVSVLLELLGRTARVQVAPQHLVPT